MPPVEEIVKFSIGQWPVRKDLFQEEKEDCSHPPLGVGRCSTNIYKDILFNPKPYRSVISNIDCFVDGPVSSLLEHCLGWDGIELPPSQEEDLPALLQQCRLASPSLPALSYLCSQGCDPNQTTSMGESALHLLLRSSPALSVPLLPLVKTLVSHGSDLRLTDSSGNTPLLAISHLLENQRWEDSVAVATHLLDSGLECDVNAVNKESRSLLSLSVSYLDASAELTRILINRGARVWPLPAPAPQVELIKEDRQQSAFTWFLKSVVKQTGLEGSEETLHCLCHDMGRDPGRMKSHVLSAMLVEGRCPRVLGPIFLQLKLDMAPFWTEPQRLRYLAWTSIRRSLGPKRLNTGSGKLGLPHALSSYLLLQSKTNAFRSKPVLDD